MMLEEFLIMRRMDEIRLEKGVDVTLNDDHTVTTKANVLNGGETSSAADHARLPPPAPKKDEHPIEVTHHETVGENNKNKYGTFFKWKS